MRNIKPTPLASTTIIIKAFLYVLEFLQSMFKTFRAMDKNKAR
jgi:hypothetical protein